MNNDKALAIVPHTLDEVRSLATQFAKSSLLPPDLRGKEADVFVTILAGAELGMPPMAALRGIHVVKGKPILSADSMVGVVLGRGVAKYFRCTDETPTSVTYETLRDGMPEPQRCTWTMEDAKRAGLQGDNWSKYPRAMLKARCKAALARDVYPDVLAGCYEEDEAREFAPPAAAKAVVVIDAVAVETAAHVADDGAARYDAIADGIIAGLMNASDAGDVDALMKEFSKLPKTDPQALPARARAAEVYRMIKDKISESSHASKAAP